MRIFDGKTYRDMTEEEIAVRQAEGEKAAILERFRPLTESEVSRMVIAQQINTLAVEDNTALRMKEFYPLWAADTDYTAGFKVQYGGNLWRCVQAHTGQAGWEPETAASLWEQINEVHTGELTDPIPYSGNMALENGKHYMQNSVIYLCIRDTGAAVFNLLNELVGIYVEVLE